MNDSPRVSVIIPALNAGPWIAEQLQALAHQADAPCFEVVIGDNGSTDETVAIARSFDGPFDVRIVDASARKSASYARNRAVEEAHGSIIAGCDADDTVDRYWLARLVSAVEASGGALVAGAVHHERFNSSAVLKAYGLPKDPAVEQPPRDAFIENPPGFAGYLPTAAGGNFAMMREDYLRVGGMNPDFPGGSEETDFAWRVQEEGIRVVSAPSAVIHYRLKSDPRKIFRQQRIQQRARIYLWTRHRSSSMIGPSFKASSIELCSALCGAVLFSLTRTGRLRSVYRLGAQIGALEGILRYRVLPRIRRD